MFRKRSGDVKYKARKVSDFLRKSAFIRKQNQTITIEILFSQVS